MPHLGWSPAVPSAPGWQALLSLLVMCQALHKVLKRQHGSCGSILAGLCGGREGRTDGRTAGGDQRPSVGTLGVASLSQP